MSLSCSCSMDVNEKTADVYLARRLKARKRHECGECGDDIEPGEVYEQVTGLWHGHWSTHKTCRLCLLIRKDLMPCGWYFGLMREDLRECLGFDYVTGKDLEASSGC